MAGFEASGTEAVVRGEGGRTLLCHQLQREADKNAGVDR